jgi:hypothetical protein
MRHVEHDDRSDRLDLRARDADGGSYRRRVAERLPRSTSLALVVLIERQFVAATTIVAAATLVRPRAHTLYSLR